MAQKRTDNFGSLSRNKRKEKPTHPSHKGSCTVAGIAYWISAYVNENKETKEKFFKLYFEPKSDASEPAETEPACAVEGPEIPF